MSQFFPRYPESYGHPAWSLHGLMNERVQQDLFWRKVQTDPSLVLRLANLLDPCAKQVGKDIFLSDETAISLHTESCGAYDTRRNGRVNCLNGNSMDKDLISSAERYPASCGYYLGPLFQQKMGWLPQKVCSNILQSLGMSLTLWDRYLFSRKACHNNLLMNENDKNKALHLIKQFMNDFNCSQHSNSYWYSSENGSIVFGTIFFFDEQKNYLAIPISAWEKNWNGTGNISIDLLHPSRPVPLYDLHELVQWASGENYALICENAWTCEDIKRDHPWLTQIMPVTTYSSIEMSDWSSLRSMKPIIFPQETAFGCRRAYNVFSTLKNHGFSPVFMKRQNSGEKLAFVQDLVCLADPKCTCNLTEFAEHCRQAFGVEPPQGILPKGQPLLELPGGDSEPELLLEGLLSLGDQMTLFAWRGVGKSLFALLLALCFANGHKALGGRVCPSRKFRVLLIDGEMPPHNLKKRARSIICGLGLPEEAANELRVRSSVADNKDLVLDTEEGWMDLLPDLMSADIIIVDSLFKVIPSAMSSDYIATKELNNFYSWCRRYGKTGIVVDHQGKNGHAAFGSMGKDIGVDAELQLSRPKNKKSKNIIEATVTKNRNFESSDQCWIMFRIENESGDMTFEPVDQAAIASSSTALLNGEGKGMENSDDNTFTPNKSDIDRTIIEYIRNHSDQSQGEIVKALGEPLRLGRSTLSERIKQLREAGQLDFWANSPAKGKRDVTSPASVEPSKRSS